MLLWSVRATKSIPSPSAAFRHACTKRSAISASRCGLAFLNASIALRMSSPNFFSPSKGVCTCRSHRSHRAPGSTCGTVVFIRSPRSNYAALARGNSLDGENQASDSPPVVPTTAQGGAPFRVPPRTMVAILDARIPGGSGQPGSGVLVRPASPRPSISPPSRAVSFSTATRRFSTVARRPSSRVWPRYTKLPRARPTSRIVTMTLTRLRQLSVNFVDFHFFPRPK